MGSIDVPETSAPSYRCTQLIEDIDIEDLIFVICFCIESFLRQVLGDGENSVKLTNKGKGIGFPLQARCGPEVG